MPIREAAELFMKYNYAETKDLCKEFLTLVSGILVFSLTFSEKIVDFRSSPKSPKILLFSSWTLFVASIISCGIALTYLALAGGQAVYGCDDYYLELANKCYSFVMGAGVFFVTGLIALVLAGMIATFAKGPNSHSASPNPDLDV
jgi:hypothetical protein